MQILSSLDHVISCPTLRTRCRGDPCALIKNQTAIFDWTRKRKSRNLNPGLTTWVIRNCRRVAFSWNMNPYVCSAAAMLTKCELLFKRLLIRKYTWKLQWLRAWNIYTRRSYDAAPIAGHRVSFTMMASSLQKQPSFFSPGPSTRAGREEGRLFSQARWRQGL